MLLHLGNDLLRVVHMRPLVSVAAAVIVTQLVTQSPVSASTTGTRATVKVPLTLGLTAPEAVGP